MPNFIRYPLCIFGIIAFVLVMLSRAEVFEVMLFDSVVLMVVSIVIFLIGYFSPAHGFDGLANDSGSIGVSTPGMGTKKAVIMQMGCRGNLRYTNDCS